MPRHSTPDRGALQRHSGFWASQTRILRDRAPLIRVSLLRPLLVKMHFGILNPARDWYVTLETGAARAVLSARRGRFCTAPVRVRSLDFPDSSFLARFWPEEFGRGGDFVVQTLRSLLRGFRTGSGIWVFGFGFGLDWQIQGFHRIWLCSFSNPHASYRWCLGFQGGQGVPAAKGGSDFWGIGLSREVGL